MRCLKKGKATGWWVGFGCGWAKLNVLQMRWLVGWLAALLILRSVGILSARFSTIVNGLNCRPTITANGFAVGDVALSFECVRAPYCLLRVICISFFYCFHNYPKNYIE
jgi:hypothetical protein